MIWSKTEWNSLYNKSAGIYFIVYFTVHLDQFTLKQFFKLVYFMDQAKTLKIMKQNPCLFQKDSPIKVFVDVT